MERRAHSASVEQGVGGEERFRKREKREVNTGEKRGRGRTRERETERDERAVCMHRSFISQWSKGKKGEKVSRVRYAE